MFNLMPVFAGLAVSMITLVLFRLVNNQQEIHFSVWLFWLAWLIVYLGVQYSAQNLQDTVIICTPIILLTALEKFSSTYLSKYLNNDRVSIIKLFLIIAYFGGMYVSKLLLS